MTWKYGKGGDVDTSDKLCFCCFKVAHVDIGDAGLPEFVYIYIYTILYVYRYLHSNMYQFVVDYMDVSQNYGGSHPVSIAWK